LSSRFTWPSRATVAHPRKKTTGRSTSANETNPVPKSVAWATSANATTAPESAAMKIDVRLMESVYPRLRADRRLQCSVWRI
jgi:hypothetical protein